MTRVSLMVPGQPVPMPRARVVRLRNGASHTYTPDEATRAKKAIRRAAELVRLPYFVGPLTLEVDAYLDGRVEYWKRGSGDWDNYAKLAQDALEGLVFGNDAAVISGTGRKHPVDEMGPRLVVTLEGEVGERPSPKLPRSSKAALPETRKRRSLLALVSSATYRQPK